jgi:hypothetical protein
MANNPRRISRSPSLEQFPQNVCSMFTLTTEKFFSKCNYTTSISSSSSNRNNFYSRDVTSIANCHNIVESWQHIGLCVRENFPCTTILLHPCTFTLQPSTATTTFLKLYAQFYDRQQSHSHRALASSVVVGIHRTAHTLLALSRDMH